MIPKDLHMMSENPVNARMSDRTGQKIGNYCLVRLLGKGNLSEVYLGEHVQQKTQVAIKIFLTPLPVYDQKKFLVEVKCLQELEHPHIVRILEAGVDGDNHFLAMTYASNGSMRQYYPVGIHLPPQRVLSYVQEITSALQYLHEHKLIHHNIRPDNLLLDENRGILLSECGLTTIAKSSRSQDMQEITGAIAYMAPEQLKGQPCPASDLYALGIIAYEWLSGEVPFQGTFREIALHQVFTPPPPLHEKVPEITSSVEEVVLITLAKEPDWRFSNAQAFANALEHACNSGLSALELRTFFKSNLSPNIVSKLDKMLAPSNVEPVTQKLLEIDTPSSPSVPLATTIQNVPVHSRPSTKRVALLATLAFLVVAISGASLIYAAVLRSAHLQTQVASTSHTNTAAATRTFQNAQASAQTQALVEATTTVTAENNLYAQATRGTPVIDDSLHFNDRDSWDVNASSAGERCLFTGSAYHVIEPQQGEFQYECFANTSNFSNFAFQAQMTILKGDEGGLVFFADKAHKSYCVFGLTSDGKYDTSLVDCTGNAWFGITGQKVVGHQSLQSNLLTVIAYNQNVSLYVNKQYVVSFKEEKGLRSGEIGMYVYDNRSATTDVAFNDALVWQL